MGHADIVVYLDNNVGKEVAEILAQEFPGIEFRCFHEYWCADWRDRRILRHIEELHKPNGSLPSCVFLTNDSGFHEDAEHSPNSPVFVLLVPLLNRMDFRKEEIYPAIAHFLRAYMEMHSYGKFFSHNRCKLVWPNPSQA